MPMPDVARLIWRNHVVPALATRTLRGLLQSCETNDPMLLQGATTSPPPLSVCADWPPQQLCLLALAGYIEEPEACATVGGVENYFADLCCQVCRSIGDPCGIKPFLNWFDEEPRASMLEAMTHELRLALNARIQEGPPHNPGDMENLVPAGCRIAGEDG